MPLAQEWAQEARRIFQWLCDPPVSAAPPRVAFDPNARDYANLSYRAAKLSIDVCITGIEDYACLIVRYHDIEYPIYTFPFNAVLDHDLVADSPNPDPKWRQHLREHDPSPRAQLQTLSDYLYRYRDTILIGDRIEYDRVKSIGESWYRSLGFMT